ncbi:hypothetical protein Q4Q94_15325 [Morganella morganii]|uniref:hypothetical protein n=1 Tax=Morganella morganii TaxID=582 RepID=UPI0031A04846
MDKEKNIFSADLPTRSFWALEEMTEINIDFCRVSISVGEYFTVREIRNVNGKEQVGCEFHCEVTGINTSTLSTGSTKRVSFTIKTITLRL